MKMPRPRRRVAATAGAVAFLFAIGGYGLLVQGNAQDVPDATAGYLSSLFETGSPSLVAVAPTPAPTDTPGSGFQPIDMLATPPPPGQASSPRPSYHPTDAPFHPSNARPIPDQSISWVTAKEYGRVALVGGKVTLLDATTNPLLMPGTGQPVPAARTLDTSWTRWIVEPPGRGTDEKGTTYVDRSYWNLCGPGATTVTLYYWQKLTGHPDVTGTSGWFVDPYDAEGVNWPSPGPVVAVSGSKVVGTYWSGSDTVSGFTAHGRGFVMYMATTSHPPIWQATGIAIWADDMGSAYYPTRGAPLAEIQTGLNWEASGRNPSSWLNTYYGTVNSWDPTLARDLQVAVMLDLGRDGVPVVAAVDTFDLPNWQSGSSTPHTRHAISIVGYDNTANPPTYSYVDTCGRLCNPRGGNRNGEVHVIAQSKMVAALQDAVGMGFSW